MKKARSRYVQFPILRHRIQPIFMYVGAAVIGIIFGQYTLSLIFPENVELLNPAPFIGGELKVSQVYAAELPAKQTYYGKVSSYSHAGCIGCSPGHKMGNQEPFDEQGMTVAVPCELITNKTLNYKMRARVTNLDTGLSAEVRITDCGGFTKYNRIVDLSKGVAEKIKSKSNNWKTEQTKMNGSNIKLEVL